MSEEREREHSRDKTDKKQKDWGKERRGRQMNTAFTCTYCKKPGDCWLSAVI